MLPSILHTDAAMPPAPPLDTRVRHGIYGDGKVVCATAEAISVRFDRGHDRHFLWVLAHGRFEVLPAAAS